MLIILPRRTFICQLVEVWLISVASLGATDLILNICSLVCINVNQTLILLSVIILQDMNTTSYLANFLVANFSNFNFNTIITQLCI